MKIKEIITKISDYAKEQYGANYRFLAFDVDCLDYNDAEGTVKIKYSTRIFLHDGKILNAESINYRKLIPILKREKAKIQEVAANIEL